MEGVQTPYVVEPCARVVLPEQGVRRVQRRREGILGSVSSVRDREAEEEVMRRVTLREMDLETFCPACGADKDEQCKGLEDGISHFGRRLKWLMATISDRVRRELVITDEYGPS
jgi:hypothetical protein